MYICTLRQGFGHEHRRPGSTIGRTFYCLTHAPAVAVVRGWGGWGHRSSQRSPPHGRPSHPATFPFTHGTVPPASLTYQQGGGRMGGLEEEQLKETGVSSFLKRPAMSRPPRAASTRPRTHRAKDATATALAAQRPHRTGTLCLRARASPVDARPTDPMTTAASAHPAGWWAEQTSRSAARRGGCRGRGRLRPPARPSHPPPRRECALHATSPFPPGGVCGPPARVLRPSHPKPLVLQRPPSSVHLGVCLRRVVPRPLLWPQRLSRSSRPFTRAALAAAPQRRPPPPWRWWRPPTPPFRRRPPPTGRRPCPQEDEATTTTSLVRDAASRHGARRLDPRDKDAGRLDGTASVQRTSCLALAAGQPAPLLLVSRPHQARRLAPVKEAASFVAAALLPAATSSPPRP